MTLLEKFQKDSDIMTACEVISLEDIKNRTYEMDFAEELDIDYLFDIKIDIDRIRNVDEFGRRRTLNRF